MYIPSNITSQEAALCQQAADIITQGGVVCFPTETVYALAASPHIPAAIERLYHLKERDKSKPIALLCSDLNLVRPYCTIDAHTELLLSAFSPGPLTVIVPCNPLEWALKPKQDRWGYSLGIRLPDHAMAQQILQAAGGMIAATSANISGQASAITAAEIKTIFGSSVDLIVDGGPSTLGIASTIIDMRHSPPILLREGSLPYAQILSCMLENGI